MTLEDEPRPATKVTGIAIAIHGLGNYESDDQSTYLYFDCACFFLVRASQTRTVPCCQLHDLLLFKIDDTTTVTGFSQSALISKNYTSFSH